jgi:hypothetical protein
VFMGEHELALAMTRSALEKIGVASPASDSLLGSPASGSIV